MPSTSLETTRETKKSPLKVPEKVAVPFNQGVHTNWPWGKKGANWNADWLKFFNELKMHKRYKDMTEIELQQRIWNQWYLMMKNYGFYLDEHGVWCINRP